MKYPFRRIEPRRGYQQVVEQIIELVREGHLKPGDRLPPEQVIASQLGVSRPTVREALSALELIGFSETRAGQFTVIRSADFDGVESRAVAVLRDQASPFEVLECRRILEVGMAGLAAERATQEQIAQIEHAFRRLGDALDGAVRWTADDEDRSFHLAVAAAAGNSVLLGIARVVVEMTLNELYAVIAMRTTGKAEIQAAVGRHLAICQAVRDHNAERAVAAMSAHFDAAQREASAE